MCFLHQNHYSFSLQELLQKVKPFIQKQNTHLRPSIPAEERLAITLRWLATGESFESLMYQYRVHSRTISLFIPEVCAQIYNVLREDYLRMPRTENEWLDLADKTYDRWQFPNCIGSIDGKHVQIRKPDDSGSLFHNYKGFFSIVLMALCDYDYRFIYVDVGCQGKISDGGVFRHTDLYALLEKKEIRLPKPRLLPPSNNDLFETENIATPFVFTADDAFSLREYCMKP